MTVVLHVIMVMLGIALGMPTAAHADEVPYVTTPTGVVTKGTSSARAVVGMPSAIQSMTAIMCRTAVMRRLLFLHPMPTPGIGLP